MAISTFMIQNLLSNCSNNENWISKEIILPTLNSFSFRNNYKIKSITFVGGNNELGNDIEYYETIGPDFFRFYTGIQVKKGDIGQGNVQGLQRQGEEAFEKDIRDTSSGQKYRISRWIVANTGKISGPAKEEITKKLKRYSKPIHFWDGIKVSDLIFEHYYREFIEKMDAFTIDEHSGNQSTQFWDPDKPLVIEDNLSSTKFTKIDISKATPVMANGILLTIKPNDKNIPPVKCIIRSKENELIINSLQSQLQPYLLRIGHNDVVEAAILDEGRSAMILARGFTFEL